MEGQFEGFRIEEVLSRGSTTTVYRAFQHSLKRLVLIKELHRELFREADILNRFKREAEVCALINHENIVDIYDCSTAGDRIFLVMEYIEGCSLADLLRSQPKLPLHVALSIMVQTLKGLDYAHGKGVIHRDLKPSNILIAQDGRVKITDFGLALFEGSPTITQPGAVVGTPAYISPEAISGGAVTLRSDLFSLGATFYQLFTGEKVFYSDHFSESLKKVLSSHPPPLYQYREEVPDELDRIIQRMLEKQPTKRWGTAGEILAALESKALLTTLGDAKQNIRRFLENPQITHGEAEPTPSSRSIRIRRSTRRKKIAWITLGTAACLLVMLWMVVIPRDGTEINPAESEKDGTLPLAPPGSDSLPSPSQQLGDLTKARQTPPTTSPSQEIKSPLKSQPEEKLEASESQSDALPEKVAAEVGKRSPGLSIPPPAAKSDLSHDQTPAKVQIQCDPWAEVFLNDLLVDRTPFEALSLPPGKHRLFFRHPAFPPVVRDIELKPGEETEIIVNFWDTVGRVVVLVDTSWAEIFIDEQSVGVTPLDEPLIVPLGVHRVTLKNPQYKVWEKSLTFYRGDPPCTLRVELEKKHETISTLSDTTASPLDSNQLRQDSQSSNRDSLPR